jgi:hypothetical protein
MARRHRLVILVPIAFLFVTACSGSGASPAVTGGATSPSAAASAEPAASPSSDAGTSVEPATSATAAASAGGAASGACELISPEEVAGVVGFTVAASADDAATCIFEVPDTNAIAVLVQVARDGAVTTFGTFKGNPEAKAVTGLGDEAVWLPGYGAVELHVLKGDALLSLAVGTLSGVPIDGFPSDISPDKLLDLAKKVGAIAVARL